MEVENPENLRPALDDESDESDEKMPELEDAEGKTEKKKSDFSSNDDVKEDQTTMSSSSSKDSEDWEDTLGSGRLKRKIIIEGIPESKPHHGDHIILAITGYFGEEEEPVEERHEIEFCLTEFEVIQAIDLIVPLMNKNETCRVLAEPEFAYGDIGLPPKIPPKAPITFIFELIDVVIPEEITKMSLETKKTIGRRKKDRGNFWYQREDYSKAIQCYRKCVEYFDDEEIELEVPIDRYSLRPELQVLLEDRIKVYNNLAQAQMKIGAWDSALASLRQVLKIEPNNEKALYRKAKAFIEKGREDEAVGLLKRVTRLYGENKQAKIDLARLLNSRKKHRENAEKLSKKMLGLDKYEKEKASKSSSSKWSFLNTSLFMGTIGTTLVGLTAFLAYKFAM